VLGGYIAKARDWAAFSREWSELLPLAKIGPRGQRRFKASEMASSSEGMEHLPAFVRVIEKFPLLGVGAILPLEFHKRALRRIRVRDEEGSFRGVDGNLVDNHYILTFISLMKIFHAARVEKDLPFDLPESAGVDFFFDERSESKAILEGWDGFKSYFEAKGWAYGGKPRFVDDEEFLPLQAADAHAYWLVRPFLSTAEQPLKVNPDYKSVVDLTSLRRDRETNSSGAAMWWVMDEEYLVREMLDLANANLPVGSKAVDAQSLPFGAGL